MDLMLVTLLLKPSQQNPSSDLSHSYYSSAASMDR